MATDEVAGGSSATWLTHHLTFLSGGVSLSLLNSQNLFLSQSHSLFLLLHLPPSLPTSHNVFFLRYVFPLAGYLSLASQPLPWLVGSNYFQSPTLMQQLGGLRSSGQTLNEALES